MINNHLSGNAQPSESDKAIKRKIKDSGRWMYIQVLDHLIIVQEDKYYSMADEGVI